MDPLTIGITFKSSAGLWKRRAGSFSRSTSRRTTSGCGIPPSCSSGKADALMLMHHLSGEPRNGVWPVSIFQSVTPSE